MPWLIMQTTLYINYATGHFRVLRALTFKTKLSAKLCCENEFYLHDNKKIIFISMALHLASLWNRGLKQLRNGLLL